MNDTNNSDLSIESLSGQRQRKNLSVAEVANNIKVNIELIKHIESGEFEKIGAPTFIKGHVTNYARAISLDPQLVLALIPADQLNAHQIKLPGSKVSSPLSRVKNRSSGFGKYVFGTFLVAALGLSFYFVYDKWGQQQALNQLTAQQTNGNQNNHKQVNANQAKETGQAGNDEKRVIYSSLLPQADLGQSRAATDNEAKERPADTLGQETSNSNSEESVDNSAQNNEAELDSVVLETDAENIANTDSEAAESSVSEAAQYQINFELAEQAWVSIEAEDGTKILTDLIGPGLRSYSANQPINFRIGNASQVKLTINNQVVDLTNGTEGNVAKLRWPKNG